MFIEDEERLSDIYSKPSDRKTSKDDVEAVSIEEASGDPSIVLDMSKTKEATPSLRDSRVEVQLSPEEIELKRKKKRVLFFSLLCIVDVALLSYIIYLVVMIFINLLK